MTPELQRGILRRFAQLVVQRAAELAILLACAGDLRWRGAWVYTAANVVILFGNAIYVLPRNPEVIGNRPRLFVRDPFGNLVELVEILGQYT